MEIYYTIEKEIDNNECTGWKDITLYKIVKNKLIKLCTISNDDLSTCNKSLINEWLEDEGYILNNCTLIQL